MNQAYKRVTDKEGFIDVSQEAMTSLRDMMEKNPGKKARIRVAGFG